MKQFRLDILAVAAPLLLSACGSFGKAMTAHTDVVARAAGHELKVRDAAQLLSTNPEIPADPQMVEALADLWIDYTLLVTASAGDTSLSALDINQLIAPDREQAIIWKLRQQVVHPDTTFTDAEVIQAWSTEGPGAEIRARHILLNLPAEATPAQRDSVRRLAEELRGRAAAGADFPALAEQYSGDQGSAAQGGDLGFFGRGRMVAPFEEAAFQLDPGEISPVVESPFGYHIIRLEERRQQELGDQLPSFRQFLSQRATQNAEQAYIDQLTESANVQVTPGAAKLAREIAQQRDARLRGRAAERVVASYTGGSLTAAELAEEIRTVPSQMLAGLATAPDEQVSELVQQIVRKELLLQDAAKRRISLSSAEVDSLQRGARAGIQQLLQATGLNRTRIPRGAAASAAVERIVKEIVQGAVSGTRQVPPLGPLGFALRSAYPTEINEGTFAKVVETILSLRASQPTPPPTLGAPQGGAVPRPVQPQPGQPQPAQPQPAQPRP